MRAVLISEALVQQRTPYQNGNSLEQTAGFTIVAEIFRQSPDVPKFSMTTGWKISKTAYLVALRVAAVFAAEPAFIADVRLNQRQTIVTSQVTLQGTPPTQRRGPPGRLVNVLLGAFLQ